MTRTTTTSLDFLHDSHGNPVFTKFSAQYYVGRLRITHSPIDTATIPTPLLKSLNNQLHKNVPIYDETAPITLKLGSVHLTVVGEDDAPPHTLTVPNSLVKSVAPTAEHMKTETVLLVDSPETTVPQAPASSFV